MSEAGAGVLGLLGGTFDPLHVGHLRLALEAREALGLSALCLIPAGSPPLRALPHCAATQRLGMVEPPQRVIRLGTRLPVKPDQGFLRLVQLRQRHGITGPGGGLGGVRVGQRDAAHLEIHGLEAPETPAAQDCHLQPPVLAHRMPRLSR